MPLFMDVHRGIGPLKPEDIISAHHADEAVQGDFGVCYHKYFVSLDGGTVFCLAEGPTKEACIAVHAKAHGLVPDDMIEVDPRLVDAFMGPAPIALGTGGAVLEDGSFDNGVRVVLFTEVANLSQAARQLGDEAAISIMAAHDEAVRAALKQHDGREVRHTGEGIMACFTSASSALRFAQDVQQACSVARADLYDYQMQLRIGITAGEPVANHDALFGCTVTTARRICDAAEPGTTLVSSAVRELAVGKHFQFDNSRLIELKGSDEAVTLHRLMPPEIQTAAAPPRARKRKNVLHRFAGELRRRHVLTVGTSYAVVFFLMLQVADLTFDPLGLPFWAYKLFLWLGLLGFPLALVLSWMFDVTPDGVERTTGDPV
jgi:class 3 adenylate cyclase